MLEMIIKGYYNIRILFW